MYHFHIRLKIPAYTPPEDALYLAGDMTDWQPAHPDYRFKRENNGYWSLSISAPGEYIYFKITRGSWHKAEATAKGIPANNRRAQAANNDAPIQVSVPAWTDLRIPARLHTVTENVVLLHPAFEIPQLGRTRRIWAYLPPDYEDSQRHYPVFYMQDGQNLFDAYGSFSGEWGVDKALNRLFEQYNNPMNTCIVVGIENGGPHRTDEYSPWPNAKHGGGEGKLYTEFLCHTLKPYVDTVLRTLPDAPNTGIMGSSMGGLISLYAALARPDVFGMAGVFSPALWFAAPQIHALTLQAARGPAPKLLLMAGQKESETMVSDLLDCYENLLQAGYPEAHIHYDLHSDGEHAEWFWAREFEHALQWLLGEPHTHHEHDQVHDQLVQFEVRTAEKIMVVHLQGTIDNPVLQIRDYCHGRMWHYHLDGTAPHQISYEAWENCVYSIRLLSDGDLVFSRKVALK